MEKYGFMPALPIEVEVHELSSMEVLDWKK